MLTPLERRVFLFPLQSRSEEQEERTKTNKVIMLRKITVRFMCTFLKWKISKRKRVETDR